jgi:hypothetical protein
MAATATGTFKTMFLAVMAAPIALTNLIIKNPGLVKRIASAENKKITPPFVRTTIRDFLSTGLPEKQVNQMMKVWDRTAGSKTALTVRFVNEYGSYLRNKGDYEYITKKKNPLDNKQTGGQ